jgi:hypothetical protein
MIAEFRAHPPKSQSVAEIAAVTPRRAEIEKRVVSELSRLEAPAVLARGWRALLADRTKLATELAELGEAAKQKDEKAIAKLAVSKARTHRELFTHAKAVGVTECSQTS